MDNLQNKNVIVIGNRESDWALDILTRKEYRRSGINLDVVVRAEDALNRRQPSVIIIRQRDNPYKASAADENIGEVITTLNKKGYKGLVLVCYDLWCGNEIEDACGRHGIPSKHVLRGVGFFTGDGSTKKNIDQFYGQLESILRTVSETQKGYERAAQPKDLVHS